MKRHKSNRFGPGGLHCQTSRPVIVGESEVVGRKPRVIATVKARNAKWLAHFDNLVSCLGLSVQGVGISGHTAEYDVTGTPEAMDVFIADECVLNWHYCLSCKVPQAMGMKDAIVSKKTTYIATVGTVSVYRVIGASRGEGYQRKDGRPITSPAIIDEAERKADERFSATIKAR